MALGLILACETVSLAPVDPPVVEDLGPTLVRAGNSQLWAVLDFRFAAGNIGSEWLIVDVAVTAADRGSARISRDGIFIRFLFGFSGDLHSSRQRPHFRILTPAGDRPPHPLY